MTLGAVRASPTPAQRVPQQVPGEWAIRNIGQKPKSKVVLIGESDWPEIQKTARHPKFPAHSRDAHPHSVMFCLAGMGDPGVLALCPLCPQMYGSPWVAGHPDPGTHLTSRALVWSSILSLPPRPPPNCLQQDPLLGPSLCHHLKTPTRRTPMSSVPPVLVHPCGPVFAST